MFFSLIGFFFFFKAKDTPKLDTIQQFDTVLNKAKKTLYDSQYPVENFKFKSITTERYLDDDGNQLEDNYNVSGSVELDGFMAVKKAIFTLKSKGETTNYYFSNGYLYNDQNSDICDLKHYNLCSDQELSIFNQSFTYTNSIFDLVESSPEYFEEVTSKPSFVLDKENDLTLLYSFNSVVGLNDSYQTSKYIYSSVDSTSSYKIKQTYDFSNFNEVVVEKPDFVKEIDRSVSHDLFGYYGDILSFSEDKQTHVDTVKIFNSTPDNYTFKSTLNYKKDHFNFHSAGMKDYEGKFVKSLTLYSEGKEKDFTCDKNESCLYHFKNKIDSSIKTISKKELNELDDLLISGFNFISKINKQPYNRYISNAYFFGENDDITIEYLGSKTDERLLFIFDRKTFVLSKIIYKDLSLTNLDFGDYYSKK